MSYERGGPWPVSCEAVIDKGFMRRGWPQDLWYNSTHTHRASYTMWEFYSYPNNNYMCFDKYHPLINSIRLSLLGKYLMITILDYHNIIHP